MWGMLLNHRDWLLMADSFPHRLDFSGREMQRTVCSTTRANDVDRAEDVETGKGQSYFHAAPQNQHLILKAQTMGLSCITCLPSDPPGGCPPWRSGSSPLRRCGAGGARHLSAWPGWHRCPGWSSAGAQHKPAHGPTSTRWRRQPPPSLWHWPATGRCRSTGCPPEQQPASGYPPLKRKGRGWEVREANLGRGRPMIIFLNH